MGNLDLAGARTVVGALRQVCAARDSGTALELAGITLCYRSLEALSDCLAAYLREVLQVGPGDFVGICLEPTPTMVVALVATLKAGAAYVPLDADLPRKRLAYMIRDTNVKVVLTQRKFSIDIAMAVQGQMPVRLFLLEQEQTWQTYSSQAGGNSADHEPSPGDLACVIYTSGTTGEPKGVMVEHGGLLNLIRAHVRIMEIGERSRLLQFASLSFDAATAEIFTSLIGGATLVLATKEDIVPGRALAAFLAHKRVTWICIAPSLLAALDENRSDLPALDMVVVAGEACPLATARAWASGGRRLFNAYGPTEATVCATMHRFSAKEERVSLGEALPGVSIYLVDETLQLVPAGTPGELCIGGVGVTRGYLNKPELTATRFLQNPWGPGRLYRTGDIAVLHPDTGALEFIGRTDNQVKIRGFRIELEAIETALREHPGVKSAAAAVHHLGHGPDTSKTLVGYIVPRPGVDPDLLSQEALARFLSERVPNHMVPPLYMVLDALPMMPNRSKVDRAALPSPASRHTGTVPATSRARQIATLFDQALSLPLGTFGVDDHFFEMGGNSLTVAHLIIALKTEFGVRIPARHIYQFPTPGSLAEKVEATLHSPYYSTVAEIVDLHAEAVLDGAITPPSQPSGESASRKPRNILLTGGTGFLGAFLLWELLKRAADTDITIHCLIRSPTAEQGLAKLQREYRQYGLDPEPLNKVHVLAGDIMDPEFQLSPSEYASLAESVDTIYHCAADINHLKPYAAMKGPNVEGTRNMLRFACTKRTKTFHYVSTLGVLGSTECLLGIDHIDESYDIDTSVPIMNVENGYTKSKWVAERLVREASTRGLPTAIYRMGFLTASSLTGIGKTTDLLARLLVGCIQLGCYPDFPQKLWAPMPVDFVASAIAGISFAEKLGTYHLMADRERELRHNGMFRAIDELGFPLQAVTPADWLEALADCEVDNALYAVAPFLLEKVHEGRNTILEVHHLSPVCTNARLHEALAGTGITIPEIDRHVLRKYLESFIASGYLKVPPSRPPD